MKPTQLTEALQALLQTGRASYIWGPPGVGKSSLLMQAAANLGLEVVDIRAVLLDPVDLRGLPRICPETNTATWCPPHFLPRKGKGVIFLDELAQSPPLVQAACLQLTLDHRIGEYVLPEGWTIVAASNRQEDRAGAHRLISPLLNRFIHLDLEVSNEDWHAWAVTAGVAPEVRSFLHYRPSLLFHFDPSTNARSFPTPRSWSFVSEVLPFTPELLWHPVFSGCVGEGPAAEFVGFLKICRSLPDLDQVLANPSTASVPKEPAVLYALSGALVERFRKADQKTMAAFCTYVGRMPAEFGVLSFRDAAAVNAKIFTLKEAAGWLSKNRDLLLSK